MRLAYADPPYPGKAHLYEGHPDYAGEVDHAELIETLAGFDGWALSTDSPALGFVLTLCPDAQVAACEITLTHTFSKLTGLRRRRDG